MSAVGLIWWVFLLHPHPEVLLQGFCSSKRLICYATISSNRAGLSLTIWLHFIKMLYFIKIFKSQNLFLDITKFRLLAFSCQSTTIFILQVKHRKIKRLSWDHSTYFLRKDKNPGLLFPKSYSFFKLHGKGLLKISTKRKNTL